ncbi:MAG: Hsp20/alpha crystallin family protein [Pseudomonadota bacterium]|jgi:HSP20 family molecular chaperone IbpA
MSSRNLRTGMWAEALELLERADRLHRQFFHFGRAAVGPSWEPPVDVFQTEAELTIVVALPGVAPDQVQIVVDGGTLAVIGERALPCPSASADICRLEIPYGRFERRIELPAGRYEIQRRQLADGCLTLVLRRIG